MPGLDSPLPPSSPSCEVPADLETIRARLANRTQPPLSLPPVPRKAAVAAILRSRGRDSEILLIRRADKEGDPWSGHMAFPGGHHDPGDTDLLSTALRETREEIGLDLAHHGQVLGRLDDLQARVQGQSVGLVVSPFVFAIAGTPQLQPNVEVADVVWAPLGAMLRGEVDAIKEYRLQGTFLELPAYKIERHVVWGMTYQMLQGLLAVLRNP